MSSTENTKSTDSLMVKESVQLAIAIAILVCLAFVWPGFMFGVLVGVVLIKTESAINDYLDNEDNDGLDTKDLEDEKT